MGLGCVNQLLNGWRQSGESELPKLLILRKSRCLSGWNYWRGRVYCMSPVFTPEDQVMILWWRKICMYELFTIKSLTCILKIHEVNFNFILNIFGKNNIPVYTVCIFKESFCMINKNLCDLQNMKFLFIRCRKYMYSILLLHLLERECVCETKLKCVVY